MYSDGESGKMGIEMGGVTKRSDGKEYVRRQKYARLTL